MSDAESVTMPVHCVKCGGAVTLFLTVWSQTEPARTQTWKCPHCHEPNNAELPGKVSWATPRERV